MNVGEEIKLYLVKNKISQSWLSEKAKIALPKLNASLHNKRKINIDEYSRICNALNVDANKFFEQNQCN